MILYKENKPTVIPMIKDVILKPYSNCSWTLVMKPMDVAVRPIKESNILDSLIT